MSWASNDGWKYSSWGVISGEPSLAHAGAIVTDQSGNVLVTHCGVFWDPKREVEPLKIPMRMARLETEGLSRQERSGGMGRTQAEWAE